MIRATFKGGACDGVALAMAIPREVPELLYLVRLPGVDGDWVVVATEETRVPPASMSAVIYGLDREASDTGLGPGVGTVGNATYRPVSDAFAAAVREALT